MVTSLPAFSAAQQVCQPDGDVDQNGSVTAADALLAFQQALSLAPLSMCQLSIANIFPLPTRPDGIITASDALCIFQKALGLPSCLDTLPPSNQEPLPLPSGHGLLAGRFTIQPGASDTHGNVMVSCPVGGSACVLTVSADGSATYAQTGGMPSVMAAYATWTLPVNHGLAVGRFTIQPGASDTHGNVVVSCPAGGSACVVNVTADGSATYRQTGGMPSVILSRPEELPRLPLQRPIHAAQAPVVDLAGTLHVGPDVAAVDGQLVTARAHDETIVSYGQVQDGVGADEIIEYLNQHVDVGQYKTGPGLEAFSLQPTVRLAEGTSDELTAYTVRAVQLVNAALPYARRILFSSDPIVPLSAIEDVPDGHIFVDFAPGGLELPAQTFARRSACNCSGRPNLALQYRYR